MEPKPSPGVYFLVNLLACCVLVASFGLLIWTPSSLLHQVIPMFWIGILFSIVVALCSLRYCPANERWSHWWEPLLCLGVVAGACLVFAPVISPRRDHSRPSCLSKVKQLAVAMHIYAADYDERLPIAQKWHDVIHPYIKNKSVFGPCPKGTSPYAYAMNKSVAGAALASFKEPVKVVLLFECASDKPSPVGGPTLFRRRHEKRGAVAFVDGHAKMIENKAGDAIWIP